ncbi:MAG: hypothetical protein ABH843_01635 [Candidatus Omnitrophota bacterium]
MIYWAPFLHFYQPPTQFHAVLKKICKESYRPLVKLFMTHPSAKVTVNISGSLTELLMDHGGDDIVKGLRTIAHRGQLEFVGSSKYHAILPLIPEEEMRRQIELNDKTNSFFFKNSYRPKGFFPPEMCYSERVTAPIAEAGYEWVLLSGIACPKPWPMNKVYGLKNNKGKDMRVLFRDDILSNNISFHGIDSKGFLEHLSNIHKHQQKDGPSAHENDIYVVTAMDAETFGHHIRNWEKLFLQAVYEALAVTPRTFKKIKQRLCLAKGHKKILDSVDMSKIKVVTISEIIEHFQKAETVEPKPSSWSTSDEDIAKNSPFPLWNDPNNMIHRYQWEHVNICLELVNKANDPVSITFESKSSADMARSLMDRAIYSCQWWWASRRPMWDINLINKGLLLQEEVIFNAYRALTASKISDDEKHNYYYKVVAARDIKDKIRDILFKG